MAKNVFLLLDYGIHNKKWAQLRVKKVENELVPFKMNAKWKFKSMRQIDMRS